MPRRNVPNVLAEQAFLRASHASAATTLQAPSNGSWSQGFWAISPANGSDSNPGTLAAPVRTYAEIVRRWGTTSPILRQNTRLVWLDSHTTDNDPVDWSPILMRGAVPSIEGVAPIVTANASLAAVTAKSYVIGSNALLQATLPAGTQVGQLLINTTAGKSSRAWTYSNPSGNVFALSQPLPPLVVGSLSNPSEVNNWATNDTVQIVNLIGINVIRFNPLNADYSSNVANAGYLYQCAIINPGLNAFPSPCFIGFGIQILECSFRRYVVTTVGGVTAAILFMVSFYNCANAGGVFSDHGVNFSAGYVSSSAFFLSVDAPTFDLDFILGAQMQCNGFTINHDSLFLDNSINTTGFNYVTGLKPIPGSPGNTLNLFAPCKVVLHATGATFSNTFVAPGLISGMTFDSRTDAYQLSGANAILGPVAITPANLDAGGRNGMFWPGAISVSPGDF